MVPIILNFFRQKQQVNIVPLQEESVLIPKIN